MVSLFHKTISPEARSCIKKGTVTGVFLEIYLGETKLIFWSTGKTANKIGSIGWQNENNLI